VLRTSTKSLSNTVVVVVSFVEIFSQQVRLGDVPLGIVICWNAVWFALLAADVRVQETVTALRAGLTRGVVLESDARVRQVWVSGERSGVVGDVNGERSELRAVEALAREPRQIARASRAIA
jgi:hypothetical protein